jgi:hypothetical protein
MTPGGFTAGMVGERGRGGEGRGERETKLGLAFVDGNDLPPQLRVGGWGHCD